MEADKIPQMRRWDKGAKDYPYVSIWQPWTAWFGFIGCLFILIVCNGSLIWSGFSTFPFLAGYLIVRSPTNDSLIADDVAFSTNILSVGQRSFY